MAKTDSRLELVNRFFAGTGASYDFMVNAATFGIDRLWKRRIVELIPPDSSRILDFACGTGISTLAIARRFPKAQIVGVELRDEYLAFARQKVKDQQLSNIEFVLSRAEDYHSDQPFDCITSSYLAKYADLKQLIPANRDMLKPGGVLIMHDFTLPPKAHLLAVWRFYFASMQRLAVPLFPSWREIYHGLPQLIETTRWLPVLMKTLYDNDFTEIRMQYLTLYGSAIVTARKPG